MHLGPLLILAKEIVAAAEAAVVVPRAAVEEAEARPAAEGGAAPLVPRADRKLSSYAALAVTKCIIPDSARNPTDTRASSWREGRKTISSP
jgi:hypothetical protein